MVKLERDAFTASGLWDTIAGPFQCIVRNQRPHSFIDWLAGIVTHIDESIRSQGEGVFSLICISMNHISVIRRRHAPAELISRRYQSSPKTKTFRSAF